MEDQWVAVRKDTSLNVIGGSQLPRFVLSPTIQSIGVSSDIREFLVEVSGERTGDVNADLKEEIEGEILVIGNPVVSRGIVYACLSPPKSTR